MAQLPKDKLLQALLNLKAEYFDLKLQFKILIEENTKLKNELEKQKSETEIVGNTIDEKSENIDSGKSTIPHIHKNILSDSDSDKSNKKQVNECPPAQNEQCNHATQVNTLKEENIKLKAELEKKKIIAINKNTNKPSSKQAEWDKKGVGNDGKGKKKTKKRRKGPRAGAGNKPKALEPNQLEKATVDECCICKKDLTDKEPLKSENTRIVEDIPDTVIEKKIIEITQEKKYCEDCQEVITAKSDLALPKADIGLNATTLVIYLWVAACMPYTKIKDYLNTFFNLTISTSGLSRHVIWVSGIMSDVYDEILNDIKIGATL
ncbi:MAG: hypothetical protein GY834_00135, partial [Bacteroidetes bacterium]|nr:hypothetical protein [Bacteroidota bacterium]